MYTQVISSVAARGIAQGYPARHVVKQKHIDVSETLLTRTLQLITLGLHVFSQQQQQDMHNAGELANAILQFGSYDIY